MSRIVIGAPTAATFAGGPDFFGDRWIWHSHGTPLCYPVTLPAGCTINAVHHRVIKLSGPTTTMTARLVSVADGVNATLGSSSLAAPGVGSIAVRGSHIVMPDVEYQIQIDKTDGPPGDDQSLWAAVDAVCP